MFELNINESFAEWRVREMSYCSHEILIRYQSSRYNRLG